MSQPVDGAVSMFSWSLTGGSMSLSLFRGRPVVVTVASDQLIPCPVFMACSVSAEIMGLAVVRPDLSTLTTW